MSRLLASYVTDLLSIHYPKIKTQATGSKYKNGIFKTFTYTLIDINEPFQIDRLVDAVRPILTRFRINFALGYILRNEDTLRYYHPSNGNSCIWNTAFDVSREKIYLALNQNL